MKFNLNLNYIKFLKFQLDVLLTLPEAVFSNENYYDVKIENFL